jgi:outer membrane receptor for ferric coprogen and ferric-rhodotorulic acid
VSAFFIRFNNRPLNTTINNEPAVVAGGQERFRGFEAEANFKLTENLKLQAEYTRNTGTYGDFVTQLDGAATSTQLSGRRLEFVPEQVIGLGLTLAPPTGWQAALSTQYIGRRWLDPENDFRAGGFSTLNALVGYRWKGWALRLSGENLGDRRDPMVASELGAGQAYRLAGRRVFAGLTTQFD